jgi:Uma2 family endonuclease
LYIWRFGLNIRVASGLSFVEAAEVSVTSVQTPTPARFNVEQFMRICEAGVFDENLRVELVEGEVLSVPPPGPEHSFGVNRLTALIHEWRVTLPAGEPRPTVSIQNSVVLSELTLLLPDITLLRPRPDDYRHSIPRPPDVGLVIEVAFTSLHYDRHRKAALYAMHGVGEYWLLDVVGRRLTVFSEPAASSYAISRSLVPGEPVAPAAFPSLRLAWWEALP